MPPHAHHNWYDNCVFHGQDEDPPLNIPDSTHSTLRVSNLTSIPFLYQDYPGKVYKYTPEPYAERTLRRGELRLATLLHYQRLEQYNGDTERGDKHEGLSSQSQRLDYHATQAGNSCITITNSINRRSADVASRCLVLCCSTVNSSGIGTRINSASPEKHAMATLAIPNQRGLWEQIAIAAIKAADTEPKAVLAAKVNYGPRDHWVRDQFHAHLKPFPAFQKPVHHEYQAEFRLAIFFRDPLKMEALTVAGASIARAIEMA